MSGVVKLKDRADHIQMTAREALNEALDLCKDDKTDEAIVFVRVRNTGYWRQGGGQTRERILWNLSYMLDKLKKEWWG